MCLLPNNLLGCTNTHGLIWPLSIHWQSPAGKTVITRTVLPRTKEPHSRLCGSSISTMELAPRARLRKDQLPPGAQQTCQHRCHLRHVCFLSLSIKVLIIIIFKCTSGKLGPVLPQEVAKSSVGQHGSAWGAATAAVILLQLRNTRERVLRNYPFLNPIYRKRVKMWMLISGRITWLVLDKKMLVSTYIWILP